MKLIVGLGNPGKAYAQTRHNMGFMVLDELVKQENLSFSNKPKFKGELLYTSLNNKDVLLLKPHTFMNLSGESVIIVKQFYQIDLEDILVIYDDLDLPIGEIRIKQKGSSGGHKGLTSIINALNSENIQRIKIGIGRDEVIPVVDYVLGKFGKEEEKVISDAIKKSVMAIHDWLTYDILYVMNKYN